RNCSYGFVSLLYLQLKMLHSFHTYAFDQHQSPNLTIPEIAISGSANASDTLFSDTSIASSPILQWRPTTRLRKLHTRFTNLILYQHPCIPCAYCGKLMYPAKTQWKPYESNTSYPIEEYCLDDQFILKKTKNRVQIPVCSKCKSNKQTIRYPLLHPIPQQILSIPLMQRRFLSPVFLHCSLGRNSGDNPFSEYRILTGDMRFSKNMRALQLYSGSMGAFMTADNLQRSDNTWCTRKLQLAAEWLKLRNCYIRLYAELLATPNNISTYSSRPFVFFFAEH